MEIVNINDDELWNPEPAIRPEDEAMLRRLHDMLRSTADDLKLISGELMKSREPKVHVKALPTPLDQEFNEKLHIEEIVNAKFHGHTIIEQTPLDKYQKILNNKNIAVPNNKPVKATNQLNPITKCKTSKNNLSISKTKFVEIDENPKCNFKNATINNVKSKPTSISYNEFTHTYIEPRTTQSNHKPLHIQEMPSINIRSELKEQKVLQLDIIPEQNDQAEIVDKQSNVAVIAIEHEPAPRTAKTTTTYPHVHTVPSTTKPVVRKISKMLTCESSESSNNISSDAQDKINRNAIKSATGRSAYRSTSKPVRLGVKANRSYTHKADSDKHQHRDLDEWKKKLNVIYGRPTSRDHKTSKSKDSSTKIKPEIVRKDRPQKSLNNIEYIPYKKLTLGGIRVSDIEKEISDLPDKNIPLSPILDKIIASQDNSCQNSPKNEQANKNILTTSDENLLEEVLDIERNITTTLSRNLEENKSPSRTSNIQSDNDQSDKASYVDDFEVEQTDIDNSSSDKNTSKNNRDDNLNENVDNASNVENKTFTKSTNLSFKSSVDVFEYVHSIDTQDHATQSNTTHKISLKATQTSPRNLQPIHNDLWPSENSKNEVEKTLNEDFIKKLILEECTEILEKNLVKSSQSKHTDNSMKNFAASQKNTQTSPAHVRSVMTSPTRSKSRMTSPFAQARTVDHQTSPVVFVEKQSMHIELDKADDLAVSINLSSPRFSLRLPQTSRDVLTNLDVPPTSLPDRHFSRPLPKSVAKVSSSSSAEDNYSSTDISRLGEINRQYKRRLKRIKVPSVSESSGSSVVSRYSDNSSLILPLKSEGEVSLGQIDRRKNKFSKSDGEVSIGQSRV
ncbi:serine-rich adhesin for platelets-like [Battus philenor]|uniref:serine-rich adhesin for platelets-like n=1 Tax=Battus philenor TaxID=42288 RepID=UPI0035CE90F7